MSTQHPRPLSPHLGIYRWQITNTLSILHRITGVGLVLGVVLLAVWLVAAAWCPNFFPAMQDGLGTIVGKLLLLGWTAAFYYHLANGLRHLNWDMGRGFALADVTASGWLVVAFTVSMTLFTWTYAYMAGAL